MTDRMDRQLRRLYAEAALSEKFGTPVVVFEIPDVPKLEIETCSLPKPAPKPWSKKAKRGRP